MQTINVRDATIALHETGSGPPVIFVHCSSASHKEWLFVSDVLSSSYRCLMPDLIGYGHSSGHLDNNGQPISCTDADVVMALLDSVDEPAELIAHSYGAVACLEAARQKPERVKSLFVIEPVLFHLLRGPAYDEEWQRVSTLARKVMAADAVGDARRCASIYMSYWIGRLRWWLSSRHFKRSVIRTVAKVAYEFSLVFRYEADAAMYALISCPVTLVAGGSSTREAHAVIRILEGILPDSRLVTIEGARHMTPFTHRGEVLSLVCEHIGFGRPVSS